MRSLLACSLLALLLDASAVADAPTITENERLLKTDPMVVTAHPDDEGMVSATMARYALDGGRRVVLVSATRGEGGGNGTRKEYGPSLGVVRGAELRACVGVLGVSALHFLDRRDFGYTESAMATLERWHHRESLRRLVRLVRASSGGDRHHGPGAARWAARPSSGLPTSSRAAAPRERECAWRVDRWFDRKPKSSAG